MTQPLHDKLLACPFCGGEPKLVQDGYYEPANLDKYPERTRSWVVCPCDTHWKRNTAAEAITAWNTRAELTRNTAIVDQLAEAIDGWLDAVGPDAFKRARRNAAQALATYREQSK